MAFTLKSFVEYLFSVPDYVTLDRTDNIAKIDILGLSETVFMGSLILRSPQESTLVFHRTYEGNLSVFFTSDGSVSFFRLDLTAFKPLRDLGIYESPRFDREDRVVIVNERPFSCIDAISKQTGVIVRHQYDENGEKFIALEFGNPKKYYHEARRFLETDKIDTVWI